MRVRKFQCKFHFNVIDRLDLMCGFTNTASWLDLVKFIEKIEGEKIGISIDLIEANFSLCATLLNAMSTVLY